MERTSAALAKISGAAADVRHYVRIQLPFKKRQNHMAHLVPENGRIGVGGILSPGHSAFRQKPPKIASAHIEERADEYDSVNKAHWLKTGKPVCAGRPLQPHDERLRNVIHVVSGGYAVKMMALHRIRKESETHTSRCHLHRFALAPYDLGLESAERQAEITGKLSHKRSILRRFPAQPMVYMQNLRIKPVRFPQLRHQHEQRSGIGSAGDRKPNP